MDFEQSSSFIFYCQNSVNYTRKCVLLFPWHCVDTLHTQDTDRMVLHYPRHTRDGNQQPAGCSLPLVNRTATTNRQLLAENEQPQKLPHQKKIEPL